MARPIQITRSVLEPHLMAASGPVSATELANTLRVNRSTVVRALTAEFGAELAKFGATRSTRYALRRAVITAGNQWPLYALNETGRASQWATLEAYHDWRWRVTWSDPSSQPEWASHFSDSHGFWSGFPFFLADIRPQGYIGRAIAQQVSRLLRVPEDPRLWSDDQVLLYLTAAGENTPGNLVVGEECLRRALAQDTDRRFQVEASQRERHYPEMALRAANGDVGSSAGGEQPKFLARVVGDPVSDDREVIVKFSPPRDQNTGARWADLLACECLALEVLTASGLARPGARLIDAGNRRFLEVPRFDRSPPEGGRLGMVSLSAIYPEADSHGISRAWRQSSQALEVGGLIDPQTRTDMLRLHAFADLIGNTDRHGGNLSFWLTDHLPFRLTPVYDMLPMLWAPGQQGEIVDRPFVPSPPLPGEEDIWREAAGWAIEFWDRVSQSHEISEDFRQTGQKAAAAVRQLRDR